MNEDRQPLKLNTRRLEILVTLETAVQKGTTWVDVTDVDPRPLRWLEAASMIVRMDNQARITTLGQRALADNAKAVLNGDGAEPDDAGQIGALPDFPAKDDSPAASHACAECDLGCPYRRAFDTLARDYPEVRLLVAALQKLDERVKR